jgi:hypothetical protein
VFDIPKLCFIALASFLKTLLKGVPGLGACKRKIAERVGFEQYISLSLSIAAL